MASIRNLKKEINCVLGDIIDAVLFTGTANTEEGKKLLGETLKSYDGLMDKFAEKTAENKGVHFKNLRKQFQVKAGELIQKLNSL